jgi:ABC-type molybdate transport system substrate-binding protein
MLGLNGRKNKKYSKIQAHEPAVLVPNGTAYAIDQATAGIMLIRREVTVENWSDPMADKYGLNATTRFGLGILRSKAIAKITKHACLSDYSESGTRVRKTLR